MSQQVFFLHYDCTNMMPKDCTSPHLNLNPDRKHRAQPLIILPLHLDPNPSPNRTVSCVTEPYAVILILT